MCLPEMLGVQSDAAPTSGWPGLFIALATDPALALIAWESPSMTDRAIFEWISGKGERVRLAEG